MHKKRMTVKPSLNFAQKKLLLSALVSLIELVNTTC